MLRDQLIKKKSPIGLFSPIHEKGFTLIELLFVIGTMTLIFSLGYANYRGFQRRQYLESAVTMIQADLRLAQEMALAGRKPDEPNPNACDTNPLNGYVFYRERGYTAGPPPLTARYQLYAICPTWTNRVLVKGPVDLPSQINLPGGFATGNRFMFRVLGRGIDQTSDRTLTLTFVGSGLPSRTITVTTAGRIE